MRPTACWTCKSPDVVRMMYEDGEKEYVTGKWAKYGDEISNSIGCADCHDSGTAELALSRDYAKRAFARNCFARSLTEQEKELRK